MIEGLWSKEVIDRVRTLFGNESVEYGLAISQNPDLVERLSLVGSRVRQIARDLETLRDTLAPPPLRGSVSVKSANDFLNEIDLALEVDEWIPELRGRIDLFENPTLYALRSAQRSQPHRAGRRVQVDMTCDGLRHS